MSAHEQAAYGERPAARFDRARTAREEREREARLIRARAAITRHLDALEAELLEAEGAELDTAGRRVDAVRASFHRCLAPKRRAPR